MSGEKIMPEPTAEPAEFKPFVPAGESPPEFTLAPVIMGTLLGIVFGASSVYLVLKVGLTVSASIPVAVLAFALFKTLSRVLKLRERTILENNIVQTAGSAGESIAFAVGFVMPALLLLGFDIGLLQVMTVGVLGGLLGILLMIPLRRVFIVKKHHELKYPEGTACADVLKAGAQGGSAAGILFAGFGIGFVYTFLSKLLGIWKEETEHPLDDAGLKGGAIGGEWTTPLLGVGYIIGPRIASIMVAGGVLAYLVITPLIVYFGEGLEAPLPPAKVEMDDKGLNVGLIKNMDAGHVRKNYILYIGAGAVAAGGIISMLQALPVIVSAILGAFRDLFGGGRKGTNGTAAPRTDRDLPMSVVVFGSIGLLAALLAAPSLGLGLNTAGLAGAGMILLFGFLFVTVSARLTGEIGSSSNPISGMTVATLLLTCLVLLTLGETGVITLGKPAKLLALMIAGVVCVACSNGGTTAQALKTGHLVGATPQAQQFAIIIGSLTSALVVGVVLLLMNQAGTVYSKLNLPKAVMNVAMLPDRDRVRSGEYADDATEYAVLNIGKSDKLAAALFKDNQVVDIPAGRYLIRGDGTFAYLVDPAINGNLKKEDGGRDVSSSKFQAPKTQLVALIINGIFDKNLPWGLVIIGVLIAITLELSGVPSLPFAVGVYLPLASSVPIFVGGAVRWLAEKIRGTKADDGDSSPGVLLSSGYIAGGSIMALIYAFLKLKPEIIDRLSLTSAIGEIAKSNSLALAAFGSICLLLLVVGCEPFRRKAS
jgi:putative OPT family oligopeptide transporter